jgi:hypothetical protein
MSSAAASVQHAPATQIFTGRVVQDTDRAVLFFVASPEAELQPGAIVGHAAWIPLSQVAHIEHDGRFGADEPAILHVRAVPAVEWKEARLVGSNQVRWTTGAPTRPLAERIPPNPVVPAIGKRPAFQAALANATVERTSGTDVEAIIHRLAFAGIVVGKMNDGTWFAATIAERRERVIVRLTEPVMGATFIEALTALERTRAERRSRTRGGQ